MAKKKSTKVEVTQHPIGYKGKVTLKLQKGGYTIKTIDTANSGTLLLFQGLAQFLANRWNSDSGKFELTSINGYIPRFLGIGRQDNQTVTDPFTYNLYNEYNIGTRIRLYGGNPRVDATSKTIIVPFTATIPYSTVQSQMITELGLFASEIPQEPTMLARVNIPNGVQLDVGMNLAVEWDIVIQNML